MTLAQSNLFLCNEEEFDTVRVWNEASPRQYTAMHTKYERSTVKMSLAQSFLAMKLVHGSTQQCTPNMKEALSRWVWHSQGLEWSLSMAVHSITSPDSHHPHPPHPHQHHLVLCRWSLLLCLLTQCQTLKENWSHTVLTVRRWVGDQC